MRSRSLFSSLFIHAVVVISAALLLSSPAVRRWAGSVTLVVPVDLDAVHVSLAAPGEAGGGRQETRPASQGRPPVFQLKPIASPSAKPTEKPRLAVAPALQGAPSVEPVRLDLAVGSPWGVVGPPSDGPGTAGRIGPGDGGGVGPGNGGGLNGVFRLGQTGVTKPRLIRRVEPDYSEEARRAKYQGRVALVIEVWPDGKAHNIRVVQSLGLGLDEQAVSAVEQWLFAPGRKDGAPVKVQARIEVSFRLL